MPEIIDTTQVDPHPFNYAKQEERLRNADTFNIAFFSDTHIGYGAYIHTDHRGINLREIDGDRALMEIAKGIIADPNVHAVVHGGDFFHRSHPTGRQVKLLKECLNMFSSNGIPVFGQAGNHDVSDMSHDLTSVALLDDPSRKIYALWTPYQAYQIHDGIFLHGVSHHGLKANEAPEVKPVAGGLNLFSTHGAALDPKNSTLMRCVDDSVREQIIPTEMIIDDNFTAKLLGHYHERYAVGGGAFNTWYAGSTVRRGFSDNAGPRGWMMFKISPDGSLDVENRNIRQRPQFDLSIIDAEGLNASEVQELIFKQVADMGVDLDGEHFDNLNAPIVRQRVVNAPRSLRAALNRRLLAELERNMLHWDLKLEAPEIVERPKVKDEHDHSEDGEETGEEVKNDNSEPSLTNKGGGGAVEFFDTWVDSSSTLASVPEKKRQTISTTARKHLETAEDMRGK